MTSLKICGNDSIVFVQEDSKAEEHSGELKNMNLIFDKGAPQNNLEWIDRLLLRQYEKTGSLYKEKLSLILHFYYMLFTIAIFTIFIHIYYMLLLYRDSKWILQPIKVIEYERTVFTNQGETFLSKTPKYKHEIKKQLLSLHKV